MDLRSSVELNNGLAIPWVGFGVFQVPPGEVTYRSVTMALEAGYRHVDTASIYGNEKSVGEAIRASGVPREELFITTKVWNDDQGYEKTLKAFEASRARLGLDRIDLYLIHWPMPSRGLFKDTYRALEKLYRDGLVRSIGVSNFLVHHLEELLKTAEVKPVINQVEFHPLLFQPKLLDFCRRNDIRLEAWSPLTRGRFLDHTVIRGIAERLGKTPAQVLLRWDLQHEVVTLPRSTKENHIKENARIFDFELSDEDMKALNSLDEGRRIGPNPDVFAG
jgi:diketogulonate reductase-like aldo/keto reductase